MINGRLTKLLNFMKESNLDQMVISDPAAIFYITGKWIHPGERMLVLYLNLKGNHRLFINELFPVNENLGIEKVWFSDIQDSIEILASYIGDGTIGIDKNWPAKFLLKLMKLKSNCEYINGSFIIDKIRASKDLEERDLLRTASRLNDAGMKNLMEVLSNKLSEKKAAGLLSEIYEKVGADGHSFDPIIAYGPNAADPHHSPDNSMLKDGDSIIIDIGCIKNSYCADMTRTVFYKSVSDKSKEIYNIVLEANKLAIAAVKPGVRFCDIDAAARDYIEACGYGKYFTHRTGHSIGIEVHDFGDVSAINTDKLEVGMCFSIEPGIYLKGEVGVRIEDLVLVTEDGCEVLNKYDKSLKVID
jgi:Xaa-Pro dipeptidase